MIGAKYITDFVKNEAAINRSSAHSKLKCWQFFLIKKKKKECNNYKSSKFSNSSDLLITWYMASCRLYRHKVPMAAFLTALWESIHAVLRSKLGTFSSSNRDMAPSTCTRFPRAAQQWRRVRSSGSAIRDANMATVLLASCVHLLSCSSWTFCSVIVSQSPAASVSEYLSLFCCFSLHQLVLPFCSPTATYANQFPTALQAILRTGMQESWRQSITPLKMSGCRMSGVGGLNESTFPKSLHVAALIWSYEWASACCSTEASTWSWRGQEEQRAIWDNTVRSSTAESHSVSSCRKSESRELAVLVRGLSCLEAASWPSRHFVKKREAAFVRRQTERWGSQKSKRLSRERDSSSSGGGWVWITCQSIKKQNHQDNLSHIKQVTTNNIVLSQKYRHIQLYSTACQTWA